MPCSTARSARSTSAVGPSFGALQTGTGALVYYAFDVLEVDGDPILSSTLLERREALGRVLEPSAEVRVSAVFDDGQALLAAVEEQGLEGVVAKRVASRYQPGKRTREWQKVKTTGRQEFVIAGYTRGEGRRAGFGALVLAVNEGGALRWAGNVGTGFTEDEIDARAGAAATARARHLSVRRAARRCRAYGAADVVWVEPVVVAEVRFAEWTHEGRLRAPVYLGLRDDKAGGRRASRGCRARQRTITAGPPHAQAVERRQAVLARRGDHQGRPARLLPRRRAGARPAPARQAVHDEALPRRLAGQELLPEGLAAHRPPWLRTAPFPATTRQGETRTIEYALVDDELALLWMVNMGCIDMHAWSSRADRPERPDWVLFDLDPSEGAGFAEAVEVAHLVKHALELVGLTGFPEDERVARDPRPRACRAPPYLLAGARVRRRDRRRPRAGPPGSRHHRVDEDEAPRRARRRQPERLRQDDRRRSTRCALAPVRPSRRPCAGTSSSPSLDPAAVHDGGGAATASPEHGDLFAGVLETAQSLTQALRTARELSAQSSPRLRGWPRSVSSAVSRRKNSETVQSTTTRNFRESSGSW